ncbi:MAG: ammonium transporter [Fluviicoccus sp.]|uniref:ammonium transporter n=1 Tax=Fluviicoccus sp. TaxID=2003552 RepID=UPI00271E593D|nr:ammonium transporter [Fluviicoccus sp.]MDO8329557.1 ammonium transporter [Fluviicoccus sp.]
MLPRRLLGPALLLLSPAALADAAPAVNSGNTAWILTATALVLFMTLPGLALFYGGLVRTKNVLSILMACFAIAASVSLLWMIGLYSLAFTSGGSANDWIGGLSRLMLDGMNKESMTGDIPEVVFAAFQMTFAIITPALIIGAFAERMKFGAMLVFSLLWTVAVYVPVAHWVWGGGWFFQRGLIDFAGGTVVHITAGVSALVAALVLGPRNGFGKIAMPPHNLTMTVTGAGMLWVGWYGFNAGSALAANGAAGMALMVTHIAASAGALTWMACEWIKFGKPSVLGIVTGMVAGLGTITGAAGVVGPGGALVIGLLAGVVCFFMTQLIKKTLKIDDSLDVFPVHGVGGILGTFLAGIFCSPALGVFSGQGFAAGHDSIGSQLGIQLAGIVVIGLYSAALTWGLLKVTGIMTGGLRVSLDEEREGLDLVLHEERGYDLN